MFVFACPIIAEISVGYFPSGQISVFALKYLYLPSYVRICPRIQLPVSAQWSQRLYAISLPSVQAVHHILEPHV